MRLLSAIVLSCTACTGEVDTTPSYGDQRYPSDGTTGDGLGGDPTPATSLGTVQVVFDTGQPPSGANVRGRAVYIWIEDTQGRYIDTIQQYFGRVTVPCPPDDLFYSCSGYRYYDDPCWDWHAATGETALLQPDPLVPPDPVTGELVVDGVTMASVRPEPGGFPESAGTVTSAVWDGRDKDGVVVPAGTYDVEMEITWERADGLGHTRPCETYAGEFPCNFRYSAQIVLGSANDSATLSPTNWMMSDGTITFTAH